MQIFTQMMGWVAAAITMLMYIPQARTILKNKSAEGLSVISYTLLLIGDLMWIIYSGFSKVTGLDILLVLQTFVPNLVIAILLIFYFKYLVKKRTNRMIYYIVIISSIVAGTILLFLPSDLIAISENVNKIILIFMVIFAAAPISIAFLPQTLNVIKVKDTKNMSKLSIILIVLGNIFWGLFWIGNMYLPEAENIRLIISLLFAIFGATIQLPILILKITEKTRIQIDDKSQ